MNPFRAHILKRVGPWPATMALGVAFLVGGCAPKSKSTETAPPSSTAAPSASAPSAAATTNATLRVFDQNLPTQPNPKLQMLKLYVGANELDTELALTELQIRTGMMFRKDIPENEAMLFVFGAPHQVGFWMKNVDIPLSCAYIDPEGIILETHDMVPHEETPIQSKTDRVQYVLETRQGWFERHGIKPGVLIRTETGALQETFVQRRTP